MTKASSHSANRRIGKNMVVSRKRTVIILSALLLSLALVFGIMSFNLRNSYRNARNDVLDLSKKSSEKNAEDIETFFLRHADVLLTSAEALEHLLSRENVTQEDVELLLRGISEAYNDEVYEAAVGKKFTGIYASVNGTLIHGMRAPSELEEGYNPLERPWYKEGKAGGGKIVFGEPYADAYDSDTIVMTATKLLNDGSTVVGMDITMDDLQAIVGNMNISVVVNAENHTYGYGFVMTENGVVMAHSKGKAEQGEHYNRVQSPMYDVYRQVKDCVEDETHFHEIKLDGVDYGLFTQRLSNGWYAVTLADLEDIKTSIYTLTSGMLIVTTIAVLIALLYCGLITGAYVRSDRLSGTLKNTLNLAMTDALTGFLNRAAYDLRVKELQDKLRTEKDESFALIMMDLNDLKYVNDHYGHTAGDQYIINCCELVHRVFSCDIYRIGGDEFALFLAGDLFGQWEVLYDRLKQLVDSANRKLTPNADEPSIAIGLSIHTFGGNDSLEALIRKADAEMYTNKLAIKQARLDNSGKGYPSDIKNQLIDKQVLASEIWKGLKEEQFEIWFQPQVNHAGGGTLIGAEVLVRWRHPERGMISPAVFIPLLEYNGLIYELDKYVWRRACECLRAWIDDGMTPLPISVNVSRLDILQPDFTEVITSIVEESSIPYDLIHLEVTETAFSEDTGKVGEIVRELIGRGFIIAIDDFGSGYSSLSLLRSVPAHIVKLDMQFFADGKDQSRNECILESIIKMVKMLSMAVIAEGVERVEQADLLRTLGCFYVQGYLYSKPLPYDEYVAYAKTPRGEGLALPDAKAYEKADAEYEQSRVLFHNIIYGTNDVIIVADSKTKQILYVNRAAEQYFGKRFYPLNPVTCAEYCGRNGQCEGCPAWDIGPGERRESVTVEDGKYLKTLFTQMDWNGHDAVVYYQIDITSEMQEFEFSNALIRNIPGATIAFALEDESPRIRYISDNALQVFRLAGVEDEKPTFKDCFRIMHRDDRERVRAAAEVTFREKTPFRESFRMVMKSGEIKWVELLVNPVANRNDSYLFYGIYTDITDRMNTQARIDAVLQSIPAAMTIYEISEDDSIARVFISDSARELLMTSDDRYDRIPSDQIYVRVHMDDRQRVEAITRECFMQRKAFTIQFRVVGEGGVIRWVQLDSKPIANEDEKVRLFYSIYTDIGAQRQAEADANLQTMQEIINLGLQEAMRQPTPSLSIEYIIGFVGRVLHGERAYIIEKNPDRTDSNTFEWVADGISPEMDYLQNVPEEICLPWYEQFKKHRVVVIEDVEDIKAEYPKLYEALAVQNIRSLIAAPFFNDYGVPMGFFGLDNPPKELLRRNSKLVQTIAYFIEAALKRINLENLAE